ncbi:MAG: hypothetical protein JW780_07295 [Clostridiales bacterium]|nr:hypothetical protein [Clostridiales bacterium]
MKKEPKFNLDQHRIAGAEIDVRRIIKGVSVVLLFVALGSIIYYIIGPARGYFHSDCTDSIFWAYTSVESGWPINPDFGYAGILPFGSSLWLIPLVGIFGLTYTTHVIGMVIFALLFFAAIMFLAFRLEWKGVWRMLFVAGMLLLLSGSDKLREIMWGHVIYYSLSILFIVTGLALVIGYYGGKFRKNSLVLLAALTLGVATDNAQMIGLYFVPLLGAIWMERFFDDEARWNDDRSKRAVTLTWLMIFMTIMGLILLYVMTDFGSISAAYANGYSTYSAPGEFLENAQGIIPNLITLFGVPIEEGASIISFRSIIVFFRLICLFIIMIFPFALFTVYRKIEDRNLKIIMWAHALTALIIIFLVTFGILGNANWRLIPMLGTAILATVYGVKWLYEKKGENGHPTTRESNSPDSDSREGKLHFISSSRKRLAVVCGLILLVNICITAVNIYSMPSDYGKGNNYHRITAFLQSQQLEYGYATFWNSQAITVLSDNEIRVRDIEICSDGIKPRMYQSSAEWFEDQPGIERYFLLFMKSEYEQVTMLPSWTDLEPIIDEVLETETEQVVVILKDNPWKYLE